MTLVRFNDEVQRSIPRVDKWLFKITAAKKAEPVHPTSAALITFDALTQDQINSFFDSTNEVAAAAFDSTSMGDFTTGFLFNYGGQVRKLVSVDAVCFSGTGGSRRDQFISMASDSLTASTLKTECAKTSLGNVAAKIDWTEWVDDDPGPEENIDILTSGIIEVRVTYFPE